MTEHRYALGREPHSPQQMIRLAEKHLYVGAAEVIESLAQPIARIRDQKGTPSCVGQAIAAAVHALTGFDGSAVNLWTDARRRDGFLDSPDAGTTCELAIESLIKRGLDPYESGEEDRSHAELSRMPDLMDELEASDNTLSPVAERFIITGGSIARQRLQVIDALKNGRAVLWATGVKDPFFGLGFDQVADKLYFGANYNGHEMRIVGYDAATDEFLIQNSWGDDWGGCIFLGRRCPGCFRAKAIDALAYAWDTMVLEIKAA